MLRLIASTACLACMISGASASDIPQCDVAHRSGHGEADHRDLGGGVVSYRKWGVAYDVGSNSLVVEACGSGHTVDALMSYRPSPVFPAPKKRFDVRDEVTLALHAAATSEDTVSFDQLAARLEAAGAVVDRRVSQDESCACNQAYPQMRGSKYEFEPSVAHQAGLTPGD